MENQLVHFKDGEFELDVNIEKETIWLTQAQICELFERERSVVTRHINNIFKEGELDKDSVSAKNAHTASDGKTYETTFYNLDVIISVGYRVKSPRGILFRKWATKVLNHYLTEGYVVNIKMLERENEKLKQFHDVVNIVHRISLESDATNLEIKNLLSVVKDYEYALDLLDQYDHKTVTIEGKVTQREVQKVELEEVYEIIQEMRRDFDSDIFGKEKDGSLTGSLYNIYQTAFGEDVYPSIEEKASNLLYFLVKNHSFVDGNKRIAAAVFMYFVKKNDIYYTNLGLKRLSDDALVALTLLIAESKPPEREIIVKIIVNLISEN
ncbi:cytochrome C biogenesis protein CycH [Acidaminobacter sp. JC074]|uniref:RhuM family protein n=1 Tax=Acidaminobacter sp. JC074 TaxID=2530199 RepID=UPI001F0F3C7E|nr:RhuM family protein [Acidaminobacter sp. JC074]MCH4890283.1 cytochrome C biogenesis protein CycH [Acidaminobacter sp. JC074]